MSELNTSPHNEQAEASLIGGLMFAPENVADVMEILSPEDFWSKKHSAIYEAIRDIFVNGGQPEAVQVAELLKGRGLLESVGGPPAIVGLLKQAGTESGLVGLAEIITNKSAQRKLIEAGGKIREIGLSSPEDTKSAISDAEELIFGISDRRRSDTLIRVDGIIDETLDRLDLLLKADDTVSGLRTGYHGLDKMTSGLHQDQLVVVGARPSMGKSAFALGMASTVALVERRPVLFFSLEMGRGELLQRWIASQGFVPLGALKNGNLMEDHWQSMHDVVARLEDAPLWIDDNPTLTVADIRAKARKFRAKTGDLGLIVIDYLQLMQGRRGAESRQVEVSEISRGCKILSKELSCPVVALSQLGRGVESRQDKRPMLSDLRESGSVEQDADLVVFLYRDEVYTNEESEYRGTAEVIVSKQRSGPTGMVRMGFLGDYTRFVNLAAA